VLAERSGGYPREADRPHEIVMIESALIKFRGDKSKTARFIGWPPTLHIKTHRHLEWTVGFRTGGGDWREAA